MHACPAAGAELSNVAQEAVVLATRRDGERVELPDLVEAVQRTRFGVNGRRWVTQTAPWHLPSWLHWKSWIALQGSMCFAMLSLTSHISAPGATYRMLHHVMA